MSEIVVTEAQVEEEKKLITRAYRNLLKSIKTKLDKKKSLETKLDETNKNINTSKQQIKEKKKSKKWWQFWKKGEDAWDSKTDTTKSPESKTPTDKPDPKKETTTDTDDEKESKTIENPTTDWEQAPKQESTKTKPAAGTMSSTRSGDVLIDKVLDPGKKFLDGIENTTKGFIWAFIPWFGKSKIGETIGKWGNESSWALDKIENMPKKFFGGMRSSAFWWSREKWNNFVLKGLDTGNKFLDDIESAGRGISSTFFPFWPFKGKKK